MKDPRTRKQPAANCGLGNIAACFLWRLLRCVGLEAALLDRSVCVIKVLRALWEGGRLLMLSLTVLIHHTIVIHYSRVSPYNRSLCGWEITFFHNAISQMQLIVQPYSAAIFETPLGQLFEWGNTKFSIMLTKLMIHFHVWNHQWNRMTSVS